MARHEKKDPIVSSLENCTWGLVGVQVVSVVCVYTMHWAWALYTAWTVFVLIVLTWTLILVRIRTQEREAMFKAELRDAEFEYGNPITEFTVLAEHTYSREGEDDDLGNGSSDSSVGYFEPSSPAHGVPQAEEGTDREVPVDELGIDERWSGPGGGTTPGLGFDRVPDAGPGISSDVHAGAQDHQPDGPDSSGLSWAEFESKYGPGTTCRSACACAGGLGYHDSDSDTEEEEVADGEAENGADADWGRFSPDALPDMSGYAWTPVSVHQQADHEQTSSWEADQSSSSKENSRS